MANRIAVRLASQALRQQPLLVASSSTSFLSSSRRVLPRQPTLGPNRRTFASSSSALLWPFSASPKPPAPTVEEAIDSTPHFVDVVTPPSPPPVSESLVEATASSSLPDAATSLYHLQTSSGLIPTGELDLTSLVTAWGPHPIMRLQSLFLKLHESFPLLGHPGLQWCILIPTVTLGLRMFLFWFQVRAQRGAAKMAVIQPEMLKNMEKLKAAKKIGDVPGQQAAQIATQQLMKDHGVNPISNLVFPLSQAAVFMCMFFALKGLAGASLPTMATEGFGWVQDLTQSDPYYALPLMSTALTLASLEAGIDSTTQVQTSTTKNMKLIFRGLLICSLPIIAYFPAALLIYWVTNNFVSLVQSLFLRQPAVRALFGIPKAPKKKQPGEPGYIPEPTFAQAFKDMQIGAQDKWDETKNNAEAKAAEVNARKLEDAMPVGYSPRKATASPAMRVLEEASAEIQQASPSTGTKGPRPFVAGSSSAAVAENEKAQRILAARKRRMRQQQH